MQITDIPESYDELKAQQDIIAQKLALKKADAAPAALAKCLSLIEEFGFTASDLKLKKGKKRVAHLDESFSKDGETYGGRGPAPDWIKALKAEHTVDKKLNVDAYKKALEAFKVAK